VRPLARLAILAALCQPVAFGQGREDLSLEDALAQLARQSQPRQPGQVPPAHVPKARFTTSASRWDDTWIATLFGSVEVTERVTMTVELDSEGYLAVGAGYGFDLPRAFVEPFFTYGRSDLLDIYDLGIFGAYMVTPRVTAYAVMAHEWRETSSFPVLAPKLFDQTEWRTTIGFNYKLVEWMDVDLSGNHYRLLTGNRGVNEVENDNISSGSLAFNLTTKPVEPFLRFTVGRHRVRPGDPVLTDSSFELGLRFAF